MYWPNPLVWRRSGLQDIWSPEKRQKRSSFVALNPEAIDGGLCRNNLKLVDRKFSFQLKHFCIGVDKHPIRLKR